MNNLEEKPVELLVPETIEMLFKNPMIVAESIAHLRGDEVVKSLVENEKYESANKAEAMYNKDESLLYVIFDLADRNLLMDILHSLPQNDLKKVIEYTKYMNYIINKNKQSLIGNDI